MKPENLDIALFKLENALSTYAQDYCIEHEIEVLFLGSQSILFSHKNINNQAIINSYEIDIILLLGKDYQKELEKISNNIDFVYGYGSSLHEEELFYIDNMTEPTDEDSSIKKFPKNWRDRSNTLIAKDNTKIKFTFLNIHDVSVLKLIANREKDLDYVQTLIQGSVLDKKTLLKCLSESSPFITEEQTTSIKKKIEYFYSLPQINIFKTNQPKIK